MDAIYGAEAAEPKPESSRRIPATLPVVDVHDLDWRAIHKLVDPHAIRARIRPTVERMEALLDRDVGPSMLFDEHSAHSADRAVCVSAIDDASPLWIIGDLHGDLLALEAALAQIDRCAAPEGAAPRIIFLGDFIDDEGFGLEVLLRVFELIVEAPQLICVIAGNHDEALSYDGEQFRSSVSPSDFADFLNANLTDEWIVRAAKVALRLTAHASRALFFADGLLIAHGGFPLIDLHPALLETGDWNDPKCLSDFVWAARTRKRAGSCRTASRAGASSVTRTSRTSARSAPDSGDRSRTWRAVMTMSKSGTRSIPPIMRTRC